MRRLSLAVRERVRAGERALVILDSNHTRAHVLAELRAVFRIRRRGFVHCRCDGIMQDIVRCRSHQPDWVTNNPQTAVKEFLAENPRFVLEEPEFPFNEGKITERVTYWPNAYLRRIE